jgi:small-conductance mechanosensitive channel
MHDFKLGEHDLLTFVKPDSLLGAVFYLALSVMLALLLARGLRTAVHAAATRRGNLDRTTISFLQQMGTAVIWVAMLILYAHLIPVLRSIGTALLAGASVASVVIGLAAQSTLGNLVAGVSITIYRPFRLGDTLQVTAPTGTEVGVVELIALGYTTLRTTDGRLITLPNSVAASQVTINLNSTAAAWPVIVTVRLSRDSDLDAARKLASEVATATAGERSVTGCYLTKVEGAAATLELRVVANDAAARDGLRSTLLAALARRFAATGIGASANEPASFS